MIDTVDRYTSRRFGFKTGLARFPGKGNGNPLYYSCLGNSMDGGACGLQSMGLQRVGHNLETRQQQQIHIYTLGNSPDLRSTCLCVKYLKTLLFANNTATLHKILFNLSIHSANSSPVG